MKNVTWTTVVVLAIATAAHAEISSSEADRLAAAARVAKDIRTTIPQQYWDRAPCVLVIPELKKAAFIIGGEYGKGVMSCRAGDSWSAPAFMQLAKGSWGFQAGAEAVDVVMLVMNESGVQKLLQNKVNLGADASVAAGPVGRQGQVSTDLALTAEILSYSRASGLFAGIDLSGGVLRPDEDANRDVYGRTATPRSILATRGISAPTQATAFLNALGTTAQASAAATSAPRASQTPARPAETVPSTIDSDIRARLVDMQQTIDRMLSSGNRPAVGTSGSANATVTVDRAQLEQLKRELEAALEALGRR